MAGRPVCLKRIVDGLTQLAYISATYDKEISPPTNSIRHPLGHNDPGGGPHGRERQDPMAHHRGWVSPACGGDRKQQCLLQARRVRGPPEVIRELKVIFAHRGHQPSTRRPRHSSRGVQSSTRDGGDECGDGVGGVDGVVVLEGLLPLPFHGLPFRKSPTGRGGDGAPPTQARAALAEVEDALDLTGWRWSRRLSLWIDTLVVLEEGRP